MHPLKPQKIAEQGGVCAYCSIPIDLTGEFNAKATMDHVIPKSALKKLIPDKEMYKKIVDMPQNLVACCESCNSIKSDMPIAKFLAVVIKGRFKHLGEITNDR